MKDEQEIKDIIHLNDKTLVVDLCYPRSLDRFNAIEINLVDVRASDGIQISYDFKRDGWIIKQPLEFSPSDFDKDGWALNESQLKARDPDWQEVSFIQSWSREKEAK